MSIPFTKIEYSRKTACRKVFINIVFKTLVVIFWLTSLLYYLYLEPTKTNGGGWMSKTVKKTVEFQMIKELLKKIQRADEIIVEDFGSYCGYLSCNGGCYSYGIRYERIDEDGNFKMIHFSSSDFFYCPVFGHFTDCCTCGYYDRDSGDCKADYGWKPFYEIYLGIIEKIISGDVFWVKIDGEIVIDCEGHFPGYCSYCNQDYSDVLYYNGEIIDRDTIHEIICSKEVE